MPQWVHQVLMRKCLTGYTRALLFGLAMGYLRLGGMVIGGPAPKLVFTPRYMGFVVVEVGLALATRKVLIY